MKKQLKTSAKMLFALALIAFFTTACSQSDTKGRKSSVEAPTMDIHMAILSGNLEVVNQHIEAGSDLNQPEPMGGSTPVMLAATFNHPQIAKALIDAGADLSIQNGDGSTALHVAAFFCRVDIVQMLIDAKADKTVKNNYSVTARESMLAPWTDMKPVYEMVQQQLSPMGLQLDINEIEKARPVIAMMLQ